MATIKDIAQLAGVSQGTVSNVLNGKGNVSSEKIVKVEQAAAALGFTINERAKLLRKGKADILAVILPTIRFRHYVDFYLSFKAFAENHGYDVIQYVSEDNPEKELRIVAQARSAMVAGIAAFSCLPDPLPAYLEAGYEESEILLVERGRGSEANYVGFDYAKCGKDLAEQALKADIERVTVVTGSLEFFQRGGIPHGLSEGLRDPRGRHDKPFPNGPVPVQPERYPAFFGESARGDLHLELRFRRDRQRRLAELLPVPRDRALHRVPDLHDAGERFLEIRTELSAHGKGVRGIPHLERNGRKMRPEAYPGERRFPKLVRAQLEASRLFLAASQRDHARQPRSRRHEEPLQDLHADDRRRREHLGVLLRRNLRNLQHHGGIEHLRRRAPRRHLAVLVRAQDPPPPGEDRAEDRLRPRHLRRGPEQAVLVRGGQPVRRSDLSEQPGAVLSEGSLRQHGHETAVPGDEQEPARPSLDLRGVQPYRPLLHEDVQRKVARGKFGTTVTLGSTGVAATEFLTRYFSGADRLFTPEGKILLTTKNAIRALEFLVEARQYAKERFCSWWTNAAKEFAGGDVAMTILYTNFASEILGTGSKIVNKIGFARVPGKNSIIGGGTLGISKFSRDPGLALSYVKWLCSEPISSALALLGSVPVARKSFENYELVGTYPWLELSKDCFATSRYHRTPSTDYAPFDERRFLSFLGVEVKNAYSGVLTPREALERAQHQYEANAASLLGL